MLARTAELAHAARLADVRVVNDEVGRLVLLVLCAGMVEVGELIECDFTIAFGVTD